MPAGGARPPRRRLEALARSHGVQVSYTDTSGTRRRASSDAIVATLAALRAPVGGPQDVDGALRARRSELARRLIEPVAVLWNGRAEEPGLRVRLPARGASSFRCVLLQEGGGERDVTDEWRPGARVIGRGAADGRRFVDVALPRASLPLGYHRLVVEAGGERGMCLVLAAPARAPSPTPPRTWGVFLPLYALRTEDDWGTGDLTGLEDLLRWVAGLGGSMVATLPILAAFLQEEPFEPSPYAPVSKRFWNELYLDVRRIPELERSEEARRILSSAKFGGELTTLRHAALVDYRRAMAMKRGVLEALAATFFADPGERESGFRRFLRARPDAGRYARFRAACERHLVPWPEWPAAERAGNLPDGGGDALSRYHLYVQWQMAEQMARVRTGARSSGAGLYLDVPLGVHPEGFDVWAERSAFALGTSVGAPPDAFFPEGQDWGFPPLHPEAIRNQGYAYPIACLRHLFRDAAVLRIDHVMGLHRLFWIAAGVDRADGVYVRYRSEEWYAILSLEATRAGATVVGEDLGTVPRTVRSAMDRRGLHRSHVAELELRPDPQAALPPEPRRSMAQVNTHDLPPFAAFWAGDDIAGRRRHGWLDEREAAEEEARRGGLRDALVQFLAARGRLPREAALGGRRRESTGAGRVPPAGPVLEALHDHLAAGPAWMVLINLEDLWLEREAQNVPGTTSEHPNWRRRTRHTFESFQGIPRVVSTLARVQDRRREG